MKRRNGVSISWKTWRVLIEGNIEGKKPAANLRLYLYLLALCIHLGTLGAILSSLYLELLTLYIRS